MSRGIVAPDSGADRIDRFFSAFRASPLGIILHGVAGSERAFVGAEKAPVGTGFGLPQPAFASGWTTLVAILSALSIALSAAGALSGYAYWIGYVPSAEYIRFVTLSDVASTTVYVIFQFLYGFSVSFLFLFIACIAVSSAFCYVPERICGKIVWPIWVILFLLICFAFVALPLSWIQPTSYNTKDVSLISLAAFATFWFFVTLAMTHWRWRAARAPTTLLFTDSIPLSAIISALMVTPVYLLLMGSNTFVADLAACYEKQVKRQTLTGGEFVFTCPAPLPPPRDGTSKSSYKEGASVHYGLHSSVGLSSFSFLSTPPSEKGLLQFKHKNGALETLDELPSSFERKACNAFVYLQKPFPYSNSSADSWFCDLTQSL